jgi:hypothetical protein
MLPASAPVDMWKRGSDLEADKERLHRELYLRTGLYRPYLRYYSNFDEWLLSDGGWIDTVDELLLASNSAMAGHAVRAEAVQRLLAEHRSGERNHRQKIVYLMSLEMYFRRYFS